MSSHTRPLPAAAHGRALAIAIAVVVIVSGFAAARADAFVYWAVSPMNTIGRANLDGTGISQSFFGAGSPQGVAVDGAHIYWADISNNSVGRANLDGTSADPDFITGADKPQAVAVDAAHVYWANTNGTSIGRADLAGTNISQSFITTNVNHPSGIAVDATHVYWTNATGAAMGRADLAGTNSALLVGPGATAAGGVALDASHVYWTTGGLNGIGRADLDGGNANSSFVSGLSAPQGVAVDAQHVYWSSSSHLIGRVDIDGTSNKNTSFITAPANVFAVALDSLLPPTASITTPVASATYAVDQVVNSDFSCTEGAGGPGIATCLDQDGHTSGTAIDTATTGPHSFTVTATSNDAATGTDSVDYAVAAAPTASITTPAPGAVYGQGQVVNSSFSCTEGAGGPGIATCTDQGGHASGTALDTATLGLHMVDVTATSSDGQTATKNASYTVVAAPTASITTPEAGATYTLGQVVNSSFSCTDGAGGPGIATCVDQSGQPSGTGIDTATTGPHTLTVTATSKDAATGTASASYTVVAAPITAPPPVLSPAPVLGSFKASRSRWRVGSALAKITARKPKRAPVGTTFSFSLNVDATVKLVFTKKAGGRLVKVKGKRRCVAPNKRNTHKRKCTLTVGSVSLNAHSGTDKVAFQGRVSRTRKLKPGRYTVTITATDASGRRSNPQSLRFTIVK